MNDFWKLSRNDTGAEVTFPQDVRWVDEFDWAATAQASPVRSLTGKLLVQQGTRVAGRLITISGDWVWHTRGTLETLRSWTDVPKLEMTLTHYDGRTFDVMFRLHDTSISVEPTAYRTPEKPSDEYTATINLITI